MEEYIKKKTLKLEILTPVHISDGAEGEIIPLEYVVSDNKILHKIRLGRFIDLMAEDKKDRLNTLIEAEDILKLRDFIRNTWQEEPEKYSSCIEYSMNAGDLYELYRDMDIQKESQLQLTPFIRSAKTLFIPGSSVKGAFRTAFITGLFGEAGIDEPPDEPAFDSNIRALNVEAKFLQYRSFDKNNKLKIDVLKDPFKCLKIGDTFLEDGYTNTIYKIHNIRIDKKVNKKEMNIKQFGEFVDEGGRTNIELLLDNRYFNKAKNEVGKGFNIDDLTDSCRKFYGDLLEYEKENYLSEFTEQTGDSTVTELYNELIKINREKDFFILRLGRYEGRNSVSFNIKNSQRKDPISRNFIFKDGRYLPLGWVKATCK